MDIQMPKMDGIEATKRIKNNSRISHIPIVALTAYAMEEDIERIKDVCDGYLSKPVQKKELINAIASYLSCSKIESDESIADEAINFEVESKPYDPELIDLLENVMLIKWEDIQRTMIIDKIRIFAFDLKQIGAQFNADVLVAYGKELTRQTELFDIESILAILPKFPGIVRAIKEN
jgi:two-component SAPR family response regulator